MAAISVPAVFKLFFFSFHWQFIKHPLCVPDCWNSRFFSFYPTPVNGILINSKSHAMTWKGRNEVFYAACNLRRVVWVFRWYNDGGRFRSRHKHNRSAFVCRRHARGQMKRLLRNNWADVKHCGFVVSSLLSAEWAQKWKSISAESRQEEEQLMTGLLCVNNRVSWWR